MLIFMMIYSSFIPQSGSSRQINQIGQLEQNEDSIVILSLSSTQENQIVPPGEKIEWTIKSYVPPKNNQGLALISVDLVQDMDNPELINLSPAENIPNKMEGFNRPNGFTNADPYDPWGSGYGGVPSGPPGYKNLKQIGGAQNTFGVRGPCLGPHGDILLGQDIDVDVGIGQSSNGQIIAQGFFDAPQTKGRYIFYLESPVANVLEKVNQPPLHSITKPAIVVCWKSQFSFIVDSEYNPILSSLSSIFPKRAKMDLLELQWNKPLWKDVILPPEGKMMNRIHMQFRWKTFDPPPTKYYLWVVEDDGSQTPFQSGLPILCFEIDGDEPRTIVRSGLEFSKKYAWCVTNGSSPPASQPIHRFSTKTLPYIPYIQIENTSSGTPLEPGVTLFDYAGATAVDENGKVIYNEQHGVTDIRLLETGRLLFILKGSVVESTLDGKVTWIDPYEFKIAHHEVSPMPNGNFLTLFKNPQFIQHGRSRELYIGDLIVEFDRHTKESVWNWSSFDYYNVSEGGPADDWTHGNAAVFNESDNSIYYSSRSFSRITRINYTTKDIIYNMGKNWPSGDTDFGDGLFTAQHAPEILPNGNMMIYDNGNWHPQPIQQTRAIELAFNDPQHPTNASIVWKYNLVFPNNGEPMFCGFFGDADRLPGGNTLITGGVYKMIFEVDKNSTLLWSLFIHDPSNKSLIYRAERLHSLIVDTPSDCDGDSDLDLIDLAMFQVAFTGKCQTIMLDFPFRLSDYDKDGDIDETDLQNFMNWMTGPV